MNSIQNQKINIELEVADLNSGTYEVVEVTDNATYYQATSSTNETSTNDLLLDQGQVVSAFLTDQISLDYSNRNITRDNIEETLNDLTNDLTAQMTALGVTEQTAIELVERRVSDFYRGQWTQTLLNDDNDDLFAMHFDYTNANATLNAQAQYNGNIAGMQWRVRGKNIQEYGFQYDDLNRLTSATYGEIENGQFALHKANVYNMNASYDINGNIQTLQRNGATNLNSQNVGTNYDVIDDLSYAYHNNNRNQLKSVSEGSTYEGPQALKGFKDGNVNGDDYIYDANGNMIEDKNKGIVIEYNHLNLPTRVTFGNGNRLEWIYDAAGIKLTKKKYNENALTLTKEYAGGLEYTNGNLEAIYFDEGRAIPIEEGRSYRYEYSIKDHLGNTRVTFADLNNNGQIAKSEILQTDHYYPFGMRMEGYGRMVTGTENAYTYNGKELNADFDLDWLDYGARWYDASIARWSAVDPLAEHFAFETPYGYVANNPIMLIDPDGRAYTSGGNVSGYKTADERRA